MKGTDHFKAVIQAYLDQRAENDELFAVSYRNPQKTLDGCINYILHTVQQSGCTGFAPEEVYSMATHFYDQPELKAGNPIECRVVINARVELTEEEKQEARRQAMQRAQNEAYAQMVRPSKRAVTKPQTVSLPSLFD